MKQILFATLSLLAVLCSTSCEKNKNDSISYPVSNDYGLNILHDSLTEIITDNPGSSFNEVPIYSISAKLGGDSKLKVVLSMEEGCSVYTGLGCVFWWIWDNYPVEPNNWTATEYDNTLSEECNLPLGHVQTFTANSSGDCNLRIKFQPMSEGSCELKVDIYENSSQSPTKTKYLKVSKFH